MRQEKPHQTYRADNQTRNYDCLQRSEGALRFLIQWSQSRADKSSIAPVRFIDSFLHNGEESISQAKDRRPIRIIRPGKMRLRAVN